MSEIFKEKTYHFTQLLKTRKHTHKQMNEQKIRLKVLQITTEVLFKKEQICLICPFLLYSVQWY